MISVSIPILSHISHLCNFIFVLVYRYVVHPKLTNFMAPNPSAYQSDNMNLAVDELFMNLFGGGK